MQYYRATAPPSTTNSAPVINEDSGEARNKAAFAQQHALLQEIALPLGLLTKQPDFS